MSNRLYTTIPAPKVPRNMFDRSAPCSLTMPFQRICPTLLEEILPGDLYRVGTETFARLQPLIAPVMNNMKISQHFFYVPLRTLNNHFAEFMFNNKNGNYNDVLPYTFTNRLYDIVDELNTIARYALAAEVIRFFDFIGLPFKYSSKTTAQLFVAGWLADTYNLQVAAAQIRVNVAPFFAYTKIWSEYFRDENVIDDPFEWFETQTTEDVMDWIGDISSKLTTGTYVHEFAEAFCQLRRRAWQHDRFTSALPFAQRGPDVLLPVSGTAPVVYQDKWLEGSGPSQYGLIHLLKPDQSGGVDTPYSAIKSSSNSYFTAQGSNQDFSNQAPAAYDPNGSLYADFDNASLTTTINEFRRAERLERWYENSARGGVRPNEATLAHFGVVTPDATLQRAQFLGGSMQPLVISEVAQTSESTLTSPQATLAGKGTSYKGTKAFRAYFTEHGFVFCLTSALVRANYWQGLPKVFSRMTRDEYYWPEFANLGEEPVYTKELYLDSSVAEDEVFGYVPRYSDYKSAVGTVHGDMRSSLSFWTQTREFANKPQLNEEFLFGDPSLSPFAVQSLYSDPIICTIQFSIKASRLMPFYGVPTI